MFLPMFPEYAAFRADRIPRRAESIAFSGWLEINALRRGFTWMLLVKVRSRNKV